MAAECTTCSLVLWTWILVQECGGLVNTTPESRLVGEVTNRSVPVGGTVKFTCLQQNIGGSSIVWRRGFEVLATGQLMITADPRVGVESGEGRSTLRVSQVQPVDSGEYVCQVSTIGQPISTSFFLDVQVPPRVTAFPASGSVQTKVGERVELHCNASGNPAPSLHWSRNGTSLRSAEECGMCLRLARAEADDSGSYICTAENGVNPAASATVNLLVQYSPVVTTDTERVATGLGQQAELTCTVSGIPVPTLSWQYQDAPLPPDSLLVSSTSGPVHRLQISSVTRQHFGNYSCVAVNSLGSFKKYLELHGRPGEVHLTSDPWRSGRTHHHVTWSLVSYTPVTEYRLLYRMTEKNREVTGFAGDWTNVIIPGDQTKLDSRVTTEWSIRNLIPDATYECIVQARNRYGWSQPSTRISFKTSVPVYRSASTQNFEKGSLIFSGAAPGFSLPTSRLLVICTILKQSLS